MKAHTFRQRVVESTFALPITAALVAVLWLLPDFASPSLWMGLGCAALMSYVVVEWNNQYQLLRIRSRMNSITFMSLLVVFPALHAWSWQLLPALAFLLSYFIVFRTYGESEPQGYVFYAFLLLSVGSVWFPALLLFLPFFYFALGRQLRAITPHSLSASWFGLLLPWACALAYWGYTHRLHTEHWQSLLPTLPHSWEHYGQVPLAQWVALAFLGLLDGLSVGHFVRTSFNDKIRTRQYYYFLLVQHLPLWTLLLLLPQHFDVLLPLLIVHATPFVAHYFALARGRIVEWWFSCSLVLLALLGLCNYFDLWTLFYNYS